MEVTSVSAYGSERSEWTLFGPNFVTQTESSTKPYFTHLFGVEDLSVPKGYEGAPSVESGKSRYPDDAVNQFIGFQIRNRKAADRILFLPDYL